MATRYYRGFYFFLDKVLNSQYTIIDRSTKTVRNTEKSTKTVRKENQKNA